MFEVIICTISTGRVVHKFFDTYDEATRCADHYAAAYSAKGQTYRVSRYQHELPAVRSIENVMNNQSEAA